MNAQPSIEQSHGAQPTLGQWIKRVIQIILLILIMDGILFLIAGRLDWIGATSGECQTGKRDRRALHHPDSAGRPDAAR